MNGMDADKNIEGLGKNFGDRLFEKRARKSGLTNDRKQCPGSYLGIIGNRNSDRRFFQPFLHYNVAPAPSDFDKPLLGKDCAGIFA
jgi:hypothetical protein